jgi:DNA-binding NarL/FixJ family response regulator
VRDVEFTAFGQSRNCNRCRKEFPPDRGIRTCSPCKSLNQVEKSDRNLTFREQQVVDLVCRAKLNKEIAYGLHLTEGTVKEYMNRIFRKLGVKSRTELAVWALTGRGEVKELPQSARVI